MNGVIRMKRVNQVIVNRVKGEKQTLETQEIAELK
jgi:hypothetical protein